MSAVARIRLGELMRDGSENLDPRRFEDETFDLYSIPAYDTGHPEIIRGRSIGSAKQVVEPGDVLLSRIVPHIRRSWVVGQRNGHRQIASGEWIVFRTHRADPRYLRHMLMGDEFHERFMMTVAGVGGSLLRARPKQVAEIQVPLPSLAEQRRIAAILDQADALRAKRRAALAQLDEMARAIFVEMFGSPANLEARWGMEALGPLLDFLTSGSRGWAAHYADQGDLFLRIQNVRRDELDLSDVAFVKAPLTAEARRTKVEPGDVLLSITADLGRTAVIPSGTGAAFINQHLAILRTKRLHPRFLSAYLASPLGQEQVLKRNRQGVKAGLNFDDIRSVAVPAVPPALQQQFAARVEQADELRRQARIALDALDSLFASLQHRAFRGEL